MTRDKTNEKEDISKNNIRLEKLQTEIREKGVERANFKMDYKKYNIKTRRLP